MKSIFGIVFYTYITGMFLYLLVYSCKHDTEDPELYPEICFEDQILPVLNSSCGISGCHDTITNESGYSFNDYSGIMKAVDPGNPDNSPVYTSLTDIWGDDFMPPDQPLSLENRTKIRLWILQGADNTICPDSIPSDSIPDDSVYINPRACFNRDVFPFIQSNCALSGCHDDLTAEEDYNFTTYSGILEAIDIQRPEESSLYQAITEDETEERMPPPPADPLPQYVIDSIFAWISYGAPDEDCGGICDTSGIITFSEDIWPLINKNCLGCHRGTNPSGNVRLENYDDVSGIASTGKLTGVLRGTGQNPLMPPAGALPECNIRKVEIWIEKEF